MTCALCDAGQPLSFGQHFRYADRHWLPLGPCTASPEAAVSAPDLASAKLHEMATRKAAVDVLSSLPMPAESREVPLPHNEIPEQESEEG